MDARGSNKGQIGRFFFGPEQGPGSLESAARSPAAQRRAMREGTERLSTGLYVLPASFQHVIGFRHDEFRPYKGIVRDGDGAIPRTASALWVQQYVVVDDVKAGYAVL